MVRKNVTIGVDLGGTKLMAGIVDREGHVSSVQRWPGRVRDYEQALTAIADLVTQLRREAEQRGDTVVAVGVAIAAFLTADRDRVRDATNLVGWLDRPLRADLGALVGLPVVVENDADAAVWGEYTHGAATGERCVAMATVGTGIGGGVVIDGNLISGGFGLAGEFGHLQVVPGGRVCGCGARGCLEAYASGTALARSARAAAAADRVDARRLLDLAGGDPDRIDGPAITRLALEGDPLARRLIAELGEWLGTGLAQVTTVLDPSVIVVGGGLVDAAGELIVEPTRAAYASALSIRAVRQVAPLRPAGLGNAAGLVGAGARAAMAAAGLPRLSTDATRPSAIRTETEISRA
jgi:glucokinase